MPVFTHVVVCELPVKIIRDVGGHSPDLQEVFGFIKPRMRDCLGGKFFPFGCGRHKRRVTLTWNAKKGEPLQLPPLDFFSDTAKAAGREVEHVFKLGNPAGGAAAE